MVRSYTPLKARQVDAHPHPHPLPFGCRVKVLPWGAGPLLGDPCVKPQPAVPDSDFCKWLKDVDIGDTECNHAECFQRFLAFDNMPKPHTCV